MKVKVTKKFIDCLLDLTIIERIEKIKKQWRIRNRKTKDMTRKVFK